ncbi:MJ0548 connectase family domain-containing protein [Methanobrevibacter wolinii]|uniref:MJ0548 connectase family domain-containing protein n=1 Tax=Methanobrevibacter wolinii TaxID=190977 RepID=UPI0005B28A15|nr:DUF2121 domain-containing protein [Methanobrevibacter wolinii]MDD5960638.1 DUF2121 domain-containing protein [Methanobrevibacter wolinii]
MSVIIAYIGKKGCVMASDKRRIAYFGDKDEREKLEEDLYTGKIRNDEELYNEAKKRQITLKISDDVNKIKKIENALMGEVSTKTTMEIRRKRIYGTTNGYQIVELLGSETQNKERGSSGIIIFGNKIAKSMANSLIKERWKSSLSLKYIGDIFEEVIKEIASKTPSVGKNVDVLYSKDNTLNKTSAQEYLDKTEERDNKLLEKYRQKLTEDLIKQQKSVELAGKIVTKGDVGFVESNEGKILKVKLAKDVQAFDMDWKVLAKPGEEIIMFLDKDNNGNEIKDTEVSNYVQKFDKVVIKDENLCLEKNNIKLNCNIILCNT